MNAKGITALYKHYAVMNQGKGDKAYNADYMTINECIQLFKLDCPMKLTKGMVKEAYALCKMTIVNEILSKSQDKYKAVEYVEFLEMIARVAQLYFKNSEMEDLILAEKIGFVLDDLLPIVSYKRTV